MIRYLVLTALLVGCGSDGGGGPSIALADYSARQIEAQCAYLTRCGLFPDADTCAAYHQVPDDPNPAAAVAAGKLAYSGTKARECIDSFDMASCDQTDRTARVTPAACNQVFTGKVAEGGTCAFNLECVSQDCLVPTCSDACCQGMCGAAMPLAKVGESCATADCVEDAFCDSTSTCRALLASGSTCDDPSACQFGLGCPGVTPGTSGTCAPLPPIGAACPDGLCADIGAVCNTGGTCVAVGLPGAACTVDFDCAYDFHCDATQHCAAYPTLGMPCDSQCSGDSWCNIPSGQTTGTCDALIANGQACAMGTQCASYYCDQSAAPPVCSDVPMCI